MHEEILAPAQLKVSRRLGPEAERRGLYLGGGTAVALQLGHRQSVDFDWFHPKALPDPHGLAQELRAAGLDLTTDSVARGTLHGSISGVRVTFLQFLYPLLEDTVPWAEAGCRLASLEDLVCMKLSAIAQRGSKRDFIDLWAIVKERISFAAALDLYRRKFEVEDDAHLLYALSYFEDAEDERSPKMLWPVEWTEVRRAIRGWLRGLKGS